MIWRVTFKRKHQATKAGQSDRQFAIETTARNEDEARRRAEETAERHGMLRYFDIDRVTKK